MNLLIRIIPTSGMNPMFAGIVRNDNWLTQKF